MSGGTILDIKDVVEGGGVESYLQGGETRDCGMERKDEDMGISENQKRAVHVSHVSKAGFNLLSPFVVER